MKSSKLLSELPEIVKEWHPTLNKDLKPSDFTYGSGKKAWFQCDKGHAYQTTIRSKAVRKTNCPNCNNDKKSTPSQTNCLSITHPEIAEQWHPILNGNLSPNQVCYASSKDAWFQCNSSPDHLWKTKIYERTKKGRSNCPYCSGQKICMSNCLATKYPEIAKEWHPSLNGDLTPFKVLPQSNKRVYWQCSKKPDHIWQTRIGHRTVNQTECPCCVGQKVCIDNCLATVYPEIAKEWHHNLNGNLTPYDVISGARAKVYWQCLKHIEHVWTAKITDRTKHGRGSGCPLCRESRGEKLIKRYLDKNYIVYERQYQFKDSEIKLHRFDFLIKHKNFNGTIEYQGEQHYYPVNFGSKNKNEGVKNLTTYVINDYKKKKFCTDNSIPILEIPFWEIDRIENILNNVFNNKKFNISSPPEKVTENNFFRRTIQEACVLQIRN